MTEILHQAKQAISLFPQHRTTKRSGQGTVMCRI